MIISEKNKYCFVAVPKTGTTAITAQLLKDPSAVRGKVTVDGSEIVVGEHDTAERLRDAMGETHWSQLYTFAFVRNPWDRVVSAYFYYRTGRASETVTKGKNRHIFKSKRKKMGLFLRVMSAKLLPFNLWVWLYRTQQHADFVTDTAGRIIVSDVYKFEALEEGFNQACEKIGLEGMKLKKENASKHKGYQSYYNQLSRRIVASRFAQDIKLFGYRFEA